MWVVGAGKPAISLADLDIDKLAPTNQLIITFGLVQPDSPLLPLTLLD
jgi:hypothetical protein